MSRMRGLVVLRCGQSSLHWDWLDDRRQNWDLLLCPYQDIDARGLEARVIPGQKWDGLAQFFATNQAWRDYDYICLPDDDIATDAPTLNGIFALCEAFKISLAAPALTPNSYFSHLITMQNSQFAARRTSFIEIMMPCFSKAFFQEILPTLGLSRSGTGFGLDYLWPNLLSYENTWTFDAAAVHHTRPAGAMRNERLAALASADLEFVYGFGIPASRKTFGGIGNDESVVGCSDPEFAEKYRRGYAYLADRLPNWSQHVDLELSSGFPAVTAASRQRVHFALAHLAAPDTTLSRGRPSLSSSTSQWSWTAAPALEATGANDGLLNGCCGFHTRHEQNPWWQVDLGAPHRIESAVIYNRLDQPLRCIDFDLLVSADAATWRVVLAKRDGIPFGGVDGKPFRHDFVPAVVGRYLRIQLAGTDFLHLDQVEVFGRPEG
jgi:F5/8 type C domain